MTRLVAGAVTAALGFGLAASAPAGAAIGDRELKLYNVHTHEKAVIVFKHGNTYDREGLKKLNQFLRDWRRELPTRMDPHLFDLIWEVYQKSGSHDYIHVICGYRSPPTNAMLRRRSKGVAKNSLHMRGKAMDFYIPDIPLAKLRAIGLRMQMGGVGFYPTSGSPFVHMDTGSVRHWPRMTRKQLVRVFPNGHTLHVPSDGKPLPGYKAALAAYKARVAAETSVASISNFPGSASRPATAAEESPTVVATDSESPTVVAEAAPPPPVAKPVGVAVASYSTTPPPIPRLAPPRHRAVAEAAPVPPAPQAAPTIVATSEPTVIVPPKIASAAAEQVSPASLFAREFDFDSSRSWSAPAVPADLARAMAQLDMSKPASLPIPPTAVVATIDVSRPLRADAITTAVLRKPDDDSAARPLPTLMAFAPANQDLPAAPPRAHTARMTSIGVPIPPPNPMRLHGADVAAGPATPIAPHKRRSVGPGLTLTALDTLSLKLWMVTQSTRQKPYALLTMPDFAAVPSLLAKPDMTFAAGFAHAAYSNLRTDRFAGALVQPPTMVDLAPSDRVASR